MRPHTLHRVIASLDLSDYRVQLVAVEIPSVTNLPTRLGIKRRVIKNDLAFFPCIELLHAASILDDCQHFAIFGAGLQIAFKHRLWKLLVRRICGLLSCAFPGSASALALLSHGTVETGLIELNAAVASRILHKIKRHAECVVELECLLSPELILCEQRLQLLQSDIERVGKPFLFGQQSLRDSLYCLVQFRIRILHQSVNRERHLVQERFGLPEQSSMRDGATNDF